MFGTIHIIFIFVYLYMDQVLKLNSVGTLDTSCLNFVRKFRNVGLHGSTVKKRRETTRYLLRCA